LYHPPSIDQSIPRRLYGKPLITYVVQNHHFPNIKIQINQPYVIHVERNSALWSTSTYHFLLSKFMYLIILTNLRWFPANPDTDLNVSRSFCTACSVVCMHNSILILGPPTSSSPFQKRCQSSSMKSGRKPEKRRERNPLSSFFTFWSRKAQTSFCPLTCTISFTPHDIPPLQYIRGFNWLWFLVIRLNYCFDYYIFIYPILL
jgi:hypothetical protein